MTPSTRWTAHDERVTHPLSRLRAAVQPYITAILASVDGHDCPMPPEDEAEVMHVIKQSAWR
jgi:hypothetical protein